MKLMQMHCLLEVISTSKRSNQEERCVLYSEVLGCHLSQAPKILKLGAKNIPPFIHFFDAPNFRVTFAIKTQKRR